mmetsp:Transcript_20790/g.47803  ORF Transcript_20790/g.47803 Transcript_20790/m.47803 type:complete len:660 (+) Transcript_20790:111-2090(+)
MIRYQARGLHHVTNLCRLQGSVFHRVFGLSALSALLSYFCKQMQMDGNLAFYGHNGDEMLTNNALWSGINFLVGFLIVFRSSQAYSRFWEGCTCIQRMHAEWVDASSSCVAFCKHSTADPLLISDFKNRLARLLSMMHALCLAEIEDCNSEKYENISAYNFEVIDGLGLDRRSLLAVQGCDAKVELVFQWIQQLLVESISAGVLSIPPPILSRAFQQFAAGLVSFHDCLKVSSVPFPFPYAQTCDGLLVMHFLATPFVTSQWCTMPAWAAAFAFMQVFFLWGLNSIACEIENPFGEDLNDIDTHRLQWQMNRHLYQIVDTDTQQTPTLAREALRLEEYRHYSNPEHAIDRNRCNLSFIEIWSFMAPEEESLSIMRTHRTMNFDTLQAEVLPRTVRMKKEMLKRLLAMTEKVERHTKRDSVATGSILRFLRSTLQSIDDQTRKGRGSMTVSPSERQSAMNALQANLSDLSEHTVGVQRNWSFVMSSQTPCDHSHACSSSAPQGSQLHEGDASKALSLSRSAEAFVDVRLPSCSRERAVAIAAPVIAADGSRQALSKTSSMSDASIEQEAIKKRKPTLQPRIPARFMETADGEIVLVEATPRGDLVQAQTSCVECRFPPSRALDRPEAAVGLSPRPADPVCCATFANTTQGGVQMGEHCTV